MARRTCYDCNIDYCSMIQKRRLSWPFDTFICNEQSDDAQRKNNYTSQTGLDLRQRPPRLLDFVASLYTALAALITNDLSIIQYAHGHTYVHAGVVLNFEAKPSLKSYY